MEWFNEPPQWSADDALITAHAAPKTDFWRITHDDGERDSGHFYFQRVRGDFVAAVKVVGDYHTLYDQAGTAIPKQRLSEGEKQIFAISLLWGLSRAAARPLPAIIDTPMARLDAQHRNQLVERYFPHASHQVVVLSTDTATPKGVPQQSEGLAETAYPSERPPISPVP